jgi:hypothetical protein
LISSSESFRAKQWTSVDLTSLIRGDGIYNIVLMTFNRTPLSLASRNAIPAHIPQLIVDVYAPSGTLLQTPISATATFIATDSPE